MMELRGENLIGSQSVRGTGEGFTAYFPARQVAGETVVHSATPSDLDRACQLAGEASAAYAAISLTDRAAFLDKLADNLAAAEEQIVPLAMAETALPEVRLRGELGRTANQIRMFAGVVRDGWHLGIRVDEALPDRAPPRPDIRLIHQPLGPVAVFGASNFPLAFSVAGGDTASALAAGCPVVAKAHPAHPGTSELVGRIMQQTIAECGLPEGVFSLLFEKGTEIGKALVADPRIQAVGFTGSRQAGLSLLAIAQGRPVPIPVYAEMSAINPVVLMPGALGERADAIGTGFAQSQSLGAGQFCTNPGLIIAVEGPDLDTFVASVGEAYGEIAPGTMLTPGIHKSYCAGVDALAANPQVELVAQGQGSDGLVSRPALFATPASAFMADEALAAEVFGAASLLVKCADLDEMLQVIDALEGQLTGAIHSADSDTQATAAVLAALERRVGRILFNGFGTGVEVCDAMVHGGPYPSTSDARTTSVGSLAITRFMRPVCYQDVPAALMPPLLREESLGTLPHRRNGQFVQP